MKKKNINANAPRGTLGVRRMKSSLFTEYRAARSHHFFPLISCFDLRNGLRRKGGTARSLSSLKQARQTNLQKLIGHTIFARIK